jgi:UDP-glucose 4-epimerase
MNEVESKQFNHPILITGGAGFLGSHMVALCLEKKVDVVVIDNLSNSDLSNLQKLELHFNVTIPFYEIDIRDKDKLKQFFKEYKFSAVIHFAGLKSVSESVANPGLYFENNVKGSKYLIDCIKEQGIKKTIFSSSATVYGDPQYLPIDETHPIQPVNPYGKTKAQVEQLFLQDEYFNFASVKLLRYFNPVGSYKGIIGEKPNGVPNNLMPYILGVARGDYDHLNIYGEDYDTEDGTGVRDYIHVMDLIEAHWAALADETPGCEIYNVGCGKGFSVKEMVKAFEVVSKRKINCRIKPRRDGDVASSYASVKKIRKNFLWTAKLNIKEMCYDLWQTNIK